MDGILMWDCVGASIPERDIVSAKADKSLIGTFVISKREILRAGYLYEKSTIFPRIITERGVQLLADKIKAALSHSRRRGDVDFQEINETAILFSILGNILSKGGLSMNDWEDGLVKINRYRAVGSLIEEHNDNERRLCCYSLCN